MATPLALQIVDELTDFDEEDQYKQGSSNIVAMLVCTRLLKREHVPRASTFAEETVDNFSDWDFKHHFRLNKSTFEVVLEDISVYLLPEATGRKPIPPRKQLLVYIWHMCNETSIRETSNLFDISKSTVHGILRLVSRVLCSFKNRFIKWPDNEEQRHISDAFYDAFGVENCIGCIDGTHIRLAHKLDGDNDYFNRKGFPSINTQVF